MPQHNHTHAIPESWFPTLIEMDTKRACFAREPRWGIKLCHRCARHADGYAPLSHRTPLHLWVSCLACNAALSLIGAGPVSS